MAAKKKRMALAEFKAWLQGVEELQSKDWSPTYEQWRLIRSKIELIVERETKPTPPPVHNRGSTQSVPVPRIGSSFIPPAPVVPGGVPEGVVVGGPGRVPMGAPPGIPLTHDGRIKTPDIDTSQGGFSSSFT